MKESNTVKEFLHSKFGAVRTVIVNEEIWMVADDVCKILEIKNTSQAVNGNPSRGDKGVGEKNRGIYNVYTLGGNQDVLCISEQGLYKLIFKSRKPFAEEFQDWICGEVIPALRKDGMYIDGEEKVKSGEMSEDELILKAMTCLQGKVARLQKEVEEKEEKIGIQTSVITTLTEEVDLAETRQRLNQLVRFGGNYQDKWAILYKEFDLAYHMDTNTRYKNAKEKKEIKPNYKSRLDYIDRGLEMIPELYQIACKLFESDYNKLIETWSATIKNGK
jgi:prophage antirepressor-like protein